MAAAVGAICTKTIFGTIPSSMTNGLEALDPPSIEASCRHGVFSQSPHGLV